MERIFNRGVLVGFLCGLCFSGIAVAVIYYNIISIEKNEATEVVQTQSIRITKKISDWQNHPHTGKREFLERLYNNSNKSE